MSSKGRGNNYFSLYREWFSGLRLKSFLLFASIELSYWYAAETLTLQCSVDAWSVVWRQKVDCKGRLLSSFPPVFSHTKDIAVSELHINECRLVCRFTVRVSDGPGGVSKLCNLLANLGVSIKDIMHERAFIRDVNSVEVSVARNWGNIFHNGICFM